MKNTIIALLGTLLFTLGWGQAQAQSLFVPNSEFPMVDHIGPPQQKMVIQDPHVIITSQESPVPDTTPEVTVNEPPANHPKKTVPLPAPRVTGGPVTGAPVTGGACVSCSSSFGGNFYGGIGFYFMQPYFDSNPAFSFTTSRTTSTAAATTTTSITHTEDFSYDYELVPRLFAGYVGGNGLGAKVSWWRYDQSASMGFVSPGMVPAVTKDFNSLVAPGGPSIPNFISSLASTTPGQDDILMGDSDIELDVWDFEITQTGQFGPWSLTASAGIRYTHLSQDYNAWLVRTGLTGGSVNSQVLRTSNVFNGAGPNVFFEGRRDIGGTGLAFYGNARAGLLFGTGRQTSFYEARGGIGGSLISYNQDPVLRDDPLPFLEGELAVEWAGCSIGGFLPTARLGVVGQNWFGAGNGSTFNTDTGNDLGFLGLNFMIGTSY